MDSDAKGWLRDAALIALFGTVFLSFTGYQWLQGYHTALSLPAGSIIFPVHFYLQASFFPLVTALGLFALFVVVVEVLEQASWGRRWVRLDILALMAVTAILVGWARMSWVVGGDGIDTPWVRFTMFSGVMAVVALLFISWVWNERIRPLVQPGPDAVHPIKRSIALSLLVILMFWTLAASFHGNIQATDLKHGCTHHDQVVFDPVPPGLENKSYIHILHHDGRYYLRDPDIGPNRGEALVVLDENVGSAHFTRVPARPDC